MCPATSSTLEKEVLAGTAPLAVTGGLGEPAEREEPPRPRPGAPVREVKEDAVATVDRVAVPVAVAAV